MPTDSGIYLGHLMVDPYRLIANQVPMDAIDLRLQPLYRAMCLRLMDGKPIDSISLTLAFGKEKWWPGAVEVSDMEAAVVSGAFIGEVGRRLRDSMNRRKLSNSIDIAKVKITDQHPINEIISDIEAALIQILTERPEPPYITLKDAAKDYMENGQDVPCVKTGIGALDDAWFLDRGGLHIIAGRTAMGKTSCACWLTTQLLAQGLSVVFFSAETTTRQLISKLFGIWTRGQRQAEECACALHENLPLYIVDMPRLTIDDVMLRTKMINTTKGVDVVVVDYLQKIHLADEKGLSREQVVSTVSASLKELAKGCNCPVVSVAQLNRMMEATADKRPALSHLRESGGIEMDADSVCLLYRPEYYLRMENKEIPAEQAGLVEFNIAKQRSRETKILNAKWEHESGEWWNWRTARYNRSSRAAVSNPREDWSEAYERQ